MRGGSGAWVTAAFSMTLTHCAPLYEEPELPTHKMALVEVERRATVETVDGAVPLNKAEPSRKFWVSSACHAFDVKYELKYVRTKEVKGVVVWGPAQLLLPFPVVAMARVTAIIAGYADATHIAEYKTDTPIRFNVPAKPGMKYWVTSTFTGEVFIPRVAVVNAANERVSVIFPNQPCR